MFSLIKPDMITTKWNKQMTTQSTATVTISETKQSVDNRNIN